MKMRKIWTMLTGVLLGFCSSVLFSMCAVTSSFDIKDEKNVRFAQNVKYDSTAKEIADVDESFTVKISNATKTNHSQSFTITFNAEYSTESYILGYHGSEEDDMYYPLTAVYNLKNKTTNETREAIDVLPLKSATNIYDGIGSDMGTTYMSISFDFVFSDTEEFNNNYFYIYNIFGFKKDSDGKTTIDKEKNYKCKIDLSKTKSIDIEPYFSASLDGIYNCGSYTTFDVTYENKTAELYKTQKATIYKKNQEDIDAGKATIQSVITNVQGAYFRLEYTDGTVKEISINDFSITSSQTIDQGKSKSRYLMKDISLDNLKSFSLRGISLTIQVYSVLDDGITKVKPNTSLVARVGCVYFKNGANDNIADVSSTNVILVIVIATIIYLIVVAGGIIGFYFYQKNKYKNDEFRRVDEKKFFKTAVIAYVGGLDFLLAILFIAFRANGFNNTYTTVNPLDNFIVVTCILLIFFVGYFVKYFITFFKDRKSRKENEKLKLNDAVDNDGTKQESEKWKSN